jgi:hypothetical protein
LNLQQIFSSSRQVQQRELTRIATSTVDSSLPRKQRRQMARLTAKMARVSPLTPVGAQRSLEKSIDRLAKEIERERD